MSTKTLQPNHRVSVSHPAGGSLIQDTSIALKPGESVTITAAAAVVPAPAPVGIRAAFYYTWYPNTWSVNGAHVATHPLLGYYDSALLDVIDTHIRALDYAKVKVLICSWWGQAKQREDLIFPILLDRIAALGSQIKVAFYYEKEGFGNPPQSEIAADLAYLKSRYGSHASTRTPLSVFVYNADDATSEVCSRWAAANTIGAYVNLKVFNGWATATPKPGGWHQYAPASAVQNVGDSYTISPGFWRADEPTPRLARDPARWKQNVRDMVASGKPWHLVTSFNEHGEGQQVEACEEWASPSGFGTYLDALSTDGV